MLRCATSASDLDAKEQALTGLVRRDAQETTRYYNMRSKDKRSAQVSSSGHQGYTLAGHSKNCSGEGHYAYQ